MVRRAHPVSPLRGELRLPRGRPSGPPLTRRRYHRAAARSSPRLPPPCPHRRHQLHTTAATIEWPPGCCDRRGSREPPEQPGGRSPTAGRDRARTARTAGAQRRPLTPVERQTLPAMPGSTRPFRAAAGPRYGQRRASFVLHFSWPPGQPRPAEAGRATATSTRRQPGLSRVSGGRPSLHLTPSGWPRTEPIHRYRRERGSFIGKTARQC
jgi:hypothetical protein